MFRLAISLALVALIINSRPTTQNLRRLDGPTHQDFGTERPKWAKRHVVGLVFQQSRYTFVVVNSHTDGVIGRVVATSRLRSPVTYKLLSKNSHIKVDPWKGTIEIMYSGPALTSSRPVKSMTFRVAARSRNPCYSHDRNMAVTWVRIIAVRLFYGDTILRAFRGNYSFSTTLNKLSREVTAGSLHRVVRRIPPKLDPHATKIATAQAKLDNACSKALFTIKEFFSRRYSTVTVSASLKHLLSPVTIRKLLDQAECPRREIDFSFCRRRAKYRSIDGTCNNLRSPLYGSASSAYKRLFPARYYDPDGMKDPLGFPDLPKAPVVPNPLYITKHFVVPQKQTQTGQQVHSHFLMQWGQWLDHDFTLAPESQDADECRRTTCQGNSSDYQPPCFTILPHNSSRCIHFTRTAAVCRTNTAELSTREQMNANTAFIDGSQIYGSTQKLADDLRELSLGNILQYLIANKGLLRVRHFSHGDLLPLDTSELMFPNDLCRETGGCFLAGDVRSSEQMALAAIHTIFVREHNRIAKKLRQINPHWSGNTTYQEARKIVGAMLQKITYEDFLPELLGYDPLSWYTGYKYWVNPGIINSFAAAAFRYGHSTIRDSFDILNERYKPVGAAIPLKHMFFNNTFIHRYGIESLVFGLCVNESERVDRSLADGIMHHLFERKHSPGLNLAALNIQRGRDHGLPGYNDFRIFCQLTDARTFQDTYKEISLENREILAKLYDDNPVIADLWVAGIAENPLPGAQVGPTFACLIKEQFMRLRDGDRFFYRKTGVFSRAQLKEIRKCSLSRILCDNLRRGKNFKVQRNVFKAAYKSSERAPCRSIPALDLNKWKDLTA